MAYCLLSVAYRLVLQHDNILIDTAECAELAASTTIAAEQTLRMPGTGNNRNLVYQEYPI